MNKTSFFVSGLAVIVLAGCSTITTGTTQPFAVKTAQLEGAKCELVDSKNTRWVVSDTPATVEITKGDGPLTVTCSKTGYKTAKVIVEEGFAGMTAGNILIGGGIGIIVDAASGAAQEYPDEVLVWMEPNTWKSSSEKEAWFAAKAEYRSQQKQKTEQQSRDLNAQGSYN